VDVQEVHRLPVDPGEELRVGVQPVLAAAPLELLPCPRLKADTAIIGWIARQQDNG
jgi:hypothetical protein